MTKYQICVCLCVFILGFVMQSLLTTTKAIASHLHHVSNMCRMRTFPINRISAIGAICLNITRNKNVNNVNDLVLFAQ